MDKKYKRNVYINDDGVLCIELEGIITITDLYRNGFTGTFENENKEDFILSTTKLNDESGKVLFKIGDRVEISIKKKVGLWEKENFSIQ